MTISFYFCWHGKISKNHFEAKAWPWTVIRMYKIKWQKFLHEKRVVSEWASEIKDVGSNKEENFLDFIAFRGRLLHFLVAHSLAKPTMKRYFFELYGKFLNILSTNRRRKKGTKKVFKCKLAILICVSWLLFCQKIKNSHAQFSIEKSFFT